ncbi:MAG: hypothetical protein A2051_03755 [Desulfovibrionales bacterium GWA2_65_9]|nr:MAG: hypothetical protein A2051_03755 [Desulfovibrionales bacterium GWA2_65_9]
MRQKSGTIAAAAAFILLFAALALAQDNSVRIPVKPAEQPQPGPPPVRMEFKSKTPAQPQTQDDEPRPSKFPNIDTAKNRQDYGLGTPKADGIRLGRDEDTGDTILGSTPPKKKREVDPYANTPIEVRPILPVRP